MSKVVTSILIISSLFVVSLSIVAILLHKNNKTTVVSEQQHPMPSITAINSLTLVPQNSTVIQGQSNTVAIMLETQQSAFNRPQLVQMEISYDPTALWDVAITPGDFFDNPREMLKIINTNTGRISYALEASASNAADAATESGNKKIADVLKKHVAYLSFIPNPSFTGAETTISFLGKTAIKGTTDDPSITATYATKLFFASGSASVEQ